MELELVYYVLGITLTLIWALIAFDEIDAKEASNEQQ